MKIIKEGISPEEMTKKETCYNCKTKFEYQNSDIQDDFRDGSYVICPKCGKFISASRILPKF